MKTTSVKLVLAFVAGVTLTALVGWTGQPHIGTAARPIAFQIGGTNNDMVFRMWSDGMIEALRVSTWTQPTWTAYGTWRTIPEGCDPNPANTIECLFGGKP